MFGSVQLQTFVNTRLSEVEGLLEVAGLHSTPELSFGYGGWVQMVWKSVPDDWSGNAETLFAEFRCCSQHDQISTFHRTETGSAKKIRRRYADMLEICGTGASDTVQCKKCNFKLYLLRHWTSSQRRTSQNTGVTVTAVLLMTVTVIAHYSHRPTTTTTTNTLMQRV